MKKFEKFVSPAACLPLEDIDTDQIIPARYLRTTEKTGLGAHLFHDWRYDEAGQLKEGFLLNDPGLNHARLLITGKNFGCGSSREHAVWALMDHGIYAVISPGFSDIFHKNSLRNGLLPITVDVPRYEACLKAGARRAEFTVNLENNTVTADSLSFSFKIDPFARNCLLQGIDDLEFILRHEDDIAAFEAKLD